MSGAGSPSPASRLAALRSTDLALELVEPGDVSLVRLYRRPGADWEEPPPKYRTMRADPPVGHQDRFAVLYLGDSLFAVAEECRVVTVVDGDRYFWQAGKAAEYKVARYTFARPALFIPVDGANARRLKLDGAHRTIGTYDDHQHVALELYERFHTVAHGLSWASYHRDQPGRVYALWHEHKATIGLARTDPATHPRLIDDEEWRTRVLIMPHLERLDAASPESLE
jgi:hypothetical protein